MKNIRLIFILCVAMGFLVPCTLAMGDAIHHYQSTHGDKVENLEWRLIESDLDVIVSKQAELTFRNICKQNGETIHWEIEGPDISIQAHRKGQRILIQGEKQGETINIDRKIDDLPWFQPLSYSLGRFLKLEEKEKIFWTVRFDNLSLHKLKAKKISTEEIMIGSKPVLAQLVEVQLRLGFSFLWNAQFWFRVQDGVFLRYESRHGFPGTEKTIISMKPGSLFADKL